MGGLALVLALGVVVSLILASPAVALGSLGAPLILLAPLVAAAGVAFLYSSGDRVHEMEWVTAVSPRLLLLARLMLVFGFNLLLGACASLLLALLLPEASFWELLVLWSAPMTLLSMLAFLLTVISGTPELGMLASMGIWAVQHLRSAS